VAYAALKGGVRLLILNDKEERLPDGGLLPLPVIRPDLKGIGIMMVVNKAVFLHQAFYNDGTKEKRYDDAADLVYNSDGNLHAYAARKGEKCFLVVNGKEGPAFDMVINPMFSSDGRFVVYRARKDGKRFVVAGDTNGKTVNQFPAYEQVFNTMFTADGKSVAYGVKDGNKLMWKVEKLEE
jgi:Tol biopolymer transport system component